MKIVNSNMISKSIYLKLANIDDAGFILSLRTNDNYNRHLSKVDNSINNQIKWLSEYKNRERLREEFYFIIYNKKNNTQIGTVRLYDFIKDRSSFSWGSWILNEQRAKTAALESALLVYNFAFFDLGFSHSHFTVDKNNEKVVSFHKKFNSQIIHENDNEYFFNYDKKDYLITLKKYEKFL